MKEIKIKEAEIYAYTYSGEKGAAAFAIIIFILLWVING